MTRAITERQGYLAMHGKTIAAAISSGRIRIRGLQLEGTKDEVLFILRMQGSSTC